MSRMQQGATTRNNKKSGASSIDAFLRARNDLSEKQRNAVAFLLQGLSDEQVASQVAADRTTIFRWRKSIPFQRELERQRRLLWDQSRNQLQSMLQPALNILQKQLTCDDPKTALRAAAILLRFATPSRFITPATSGNSAGRAEKNRDFDDLMAYVDAPLPGEPGAPEDMVGEDFDDDELEEHDE